MNGEEDDIKDSATAQAAGVQVVVVVPLENWL
jgi:hypothetical protein